MHTSHDQSGPPKGWWPPTQKLTWQLRGEKRDEVQLAGAAGAAGGRAAVARKRKTGEKGAGAAVKGHWGCSCRATALGAVTGAGAPHCRARHCTSGRLPQLYQHMRVGPMHVTAGTRPHGVSGPPASAVAEPESRRSVPRATTRCWQRSDLLAPPRPLQSAALLPFNCTLLRTPPHSNPALLPSNCILLHSTPLHSPHSTAL